MKFSSSSLILSLSAKYSCSGCARLVILEREFVVVFLIPNIYLSSLRTLLLPIADVGFGYYYSLDFHTFNFCDQYGLLRDVHR